LARKYLQIPATSASSERFFSQGGLVINKLRNKLNKDTFNMILCLKSWGIITKEEEEIKNKDNSQEEANFEI
jgi:hypothetical protein